MPLRPTISLIVPTRGRSDKLSRFLGSIAATAARPDRLEVVLVVDDDDPQSLAIGHPLLHLKHVVGPPGRTMGAMNGEGYAAAAGEFLMLLNDDVLIRTRHWDTAVLKCARRFTDGISLIHVNDLLIRGHLCTFPLVSRRFCELAGGICPEEYHRYRIDDHIEDAFNLMAAMGVRRTIYLPDVVFEHLNAVERPGAGRIYESDSSILSEDAPRFLAAFPARKELSLRLLEVIEGGCSNPLTMATRRAFLESISDPFVLRTPGRQIVVRAPWWKRSADLASWAKLTRFRVRSCYAGGGCAGLVRAVGRQLARAVAAHRPRTSAAAQR